MIPDTVCLSPTAVASYNDKTGRWHDEPLCVSRTVLVVAVVESLAPMGDQLGLTEHLTAAIGPGVRGKHSALKTVKHSSGDFSVSSL